MTGSRHTVGNEMLLCLTRHILPELEIPTFHVSAESLKGRKDVLRSRNRTVRGVEDGWKRYIVRSCNRARFSTRGPGLGPETPELPGRYLEISR